MANFKGKTIVITGAAVNVASVGGIRGVLNQTAYVATQHAGWVSPKKLVTWLPFY